MADLTPSHCVPFSIQALPLAPQNLRIYLSLTLFSNKEILKFDWMSSLFENILRL